MDPLIKLLLLILFQNGYCFGEYSSVIAVCESKCEVSNCTIGVSHKCGIEDIANISTDNTRVRLCSSEILLNFELRIFDIKNFSMVGYHNPVIKCPSDTLAGIRLDGIQSLELLNFRIVNCGLRIWSANDSEPEIKTNSSIKSSMNIRNSLNVVISNVNITAGQGIGLALLLNAGNVKVLNSTFFGNGQDKESAGSGVYMEHNKSSSLITEYSFDHCKFINNSAVLSSITLPNFDHRFSRYKSGGGLSVHILQSENVLVLINDSLFEGNLAQEFGGGLHTCFVGDARNGNISVISSNFTWNRSFHGGGSCMGYLHINNPLTIPRECSYFLKDINFDNNTANFGGGTAIFSTRTVSIDLNASVVYENCTWKNNRGHFGSAISILPNAWNIYAEGYLPSPIFVDCTVESNFVRPNVTKDGKNYTQYTKGAGAFYCSQHMVNFTNQIEFASNNGSAMYLDNCIVHFLTYSAINFTNNSAYQGGAIHVLSSIIYLHNNVSVCFRNNTAHDKGGAIYQESSALHNSEYSATCFINFINSTNATDDSGIRVKFWDNEAGTGNNITISGYGHSIYASSLLPCHRRDPFSEVNLTIDMFDQVGEFSYYPHNRTMEVTTAVHHVESHDLNLYQVSFIPGRETNIQYTNYDDLKQCIRAEYSVTIDNQNGANIQTSQAYSHITDKMVLYGRVGDQATVFLSSLSQRQLTLSFTVKLQPCSPGFIQQFNTTTSKSGSCVCDDSEYVGIICKLQLSFRARGYWIGYDSNQSESEDSLVSSFCPSNFCKYNTSTQLPNSSASREKLDQFVCINNHTGIVCGHCRENNSVYYHSLGFKCMYNQHCKWGWLFYILSEIIPVTIIFIIVIFFNISFTSGEMNGFIFYAQVATFLHITADNSIPLSNLARVFLKVHFLLFHTFNLDTFILDELSFCIWKNANTLDTLSFKHVTLVYSFILVISLIIVTNMCIAHIRCNCYRSRWHNYTGSILHGLSAFLVLSFSHCVNNAILIFASNSIYSKGQHLDRIVAYYDGGIVWMSSQHLVYAIPSLVLLILVLLPPLLLLIYPLHYKVLTFLKIADTRFVVFIFGPLVKLKPFMDSFQGCFKDNFRFFSGLYFIYRSLFIISMTFPRLEFAYILLEVLLLSMLILHAVCQPYKKRLHNIIDALLFGNLAVINAITMYNFSTLRSVIPLDVSITSWIQIILIFFPLLIMLIYLALKIPHAIILTYRNLQRNAQYDEISDELPARMLHSRD